MRYFRTSLAENVRDGRVAKGWTIRELALRAGVSTRTIVAAENELWHASDLTIGKLAEALGTTVDKLASPLPF